MSLLPHQLQYKLVFLPAAKRHGQGKVWVGIVVLLHQTIVSLVCFSFIFAMCVGILGQHGTVPKFSRSLTCNFYLQIFTCKFYLFFKILKTNRNVQKYLIFIFFQNFLYLFIPINALKLYLRYMSQVRLKGKGANIINNY